MRKGFNWWMHRSGSCRARITDFCKSNRKVSWQCRTSPSSSTARRQSRKELFKTQESWVTNLKAVMSAHFSSMGLHSKRLGRWQRTWSCHSSRRRQSLRYRQTRKSDTRGGTSTLLTSMWTSSWHSKATVRVRSPQKATTLRTKAFREGSPKTISAYLTLT